MINGRSVHSYLILYIILALTIACGGGVEDGAENLDPNNPFAPSNTSVNDQARVGNTNTNTNLSSPTNITTTSSDNTLNISWDKVSGADSYNIYYGNSEEIDISQANRVTGVTTEFYFLRGLDNNKQYFIVVTAVNEEGESVASMESNAIPVEVIEVPTPPMNVSATALNNKIFLSWDTIPNASSYSIYYGNSTGVSSSSFKVDTVNTTSFTHEGLSAGTTYYYVVVAENSAGQSSESSEVNATPDSQIVTIPNPPANFTASSGNGQINLSWNPVAGADTYNLYFKNTTGVTVLDTIISSGNNTTSSIHENLSNGTTYFYVVTATNSAGESLVSDEVSATPVEPVVAPEAPTNLVATAGNTQVILTWNAVSEADSYRLYFKNSTGVSIADTLIYNGNNTNYLHEDLTNGSSHFYMVTAVKSSLESVESNEANATPIAPIVAPNAPTNLLATAGDELVNLSWDAVTGADSYSLHYSDTAGATSSANWLQATTGTNLVHSSLNNGEDYFYIVTAYNSAGNSIDSDEASATPVAPITAPNAPQNLTATAGDELVNLSWNTVTGAESYSLHYSDITGATSSANWLQATTGTNLVHSGLSKRR